MTEKAAKYTPKVTGEVASKWRSLPVTKAEGGSYESGTENPDHRARWLEHGVEPHDLKPKRAEALGGATGRRSPSGLRRKPHAEPSDGRGGVRDSGDRAAAPDGLGG